MHNLTARNPLGIIALFLSLIYGVAALLLGASVSNLTSNNQTILVSFIALFPVGVLIAFMYLVSWHHQKLYGPGDFRSDESFLTAAEPHSVGLKYKDDASVLNDEGPASGLNMPEPEQGQPTAAQGAQQAAIARNRPPQLRSDGGIARAYMLEGLVLQDLQNEFKSPVRRDARLSGKYGASIMVDGVIETINGHVVVEVALLGLRAGSIEKALRGLDYLNKAISNLSSADISNARGILAVIYPGSLQLDGDKDLDQYKAVRDALSTAWNENVEVRFFSESKLMSKYGFGEDASNKGLEG